MWSGIRKSYDAVAREYADEIYGELAGKPFDRDLLDRFAERVRGRGPVCDLGCGPAQIARYLRDRGVDAFGVDLSAGMLAQARRLNPDLQFLQASMLALGLRSETLAGVAAFYSIIHIARSKVVEALANKRAEYCNRAACFCLLFTWAGRQSSRRIVRQAGQSRYRPFTSDEMRGYFEGRGVTVEQVLERDPYSPDVEYQSRRGVHLASRSKG
jgi:SAM-dependent methyltransferase